MSAIRIYAVAEGATHPLDTRERMYAWFSAAPRVADYFVAYRDVEYEFDGVPFGEPVSPSDLVAKALSRIPGNAPRNRIAEWSLYDDFTRGQCGWLGIALAHALGGRLMMCGLLPGVYPTDDEPKATDTPWHLLGPSYMDGFMHVGMLIGDHVYCAQGRQDPDAWAHGISRNAEMGMCGLVEGKTLLPHLPRLAPAVAETIPDVVNLIAQLIGDECEPSHPPSWERHLAAGEPRTWTPPRWWTELENDHVLDDMDF